MYEEGKVVINLIKRNVIVQKWQIYIFIPFILFFVIGNVPPVLTFLVACTFIPFNALTYDERAKTDILLNSLPYTRKEIIASRYIGAAVYMVISLAITSGVLYIFQKPFTLTHIVIGAGLFLTFVALTLPIYVLVKQGNVTLFILIGFIVSVWLIGPVVSFITNNFPGFVEFIISLSNSSLYLVGFIAVILLYILSWGISTLVYERKVF